MSSDDVADYDLQIAVITPAATNAALNMRSVSSDFVDSTFMDTVSEWKHCEYEAKTNSDVQVRTASGGWICPGNIQLTISLEASELSIPAPNLHWLPSKAHYPITRRTAFVVT